ncbi:probable LRR receptor-like serine/threonine-protein kinase At1g56130 isoform X3 [Capsicum annuum]|uniref:probable LRR receptor-like serine/threonine-protein kinase At1g56130 isoform X3 n=1 Tax=Capsicum annuum TaxID=4072 RepID=UPI0007BF52D2|nr:probable LRR receptor-like serine/threonine-protein kinase At1g56130 isoform X3 [Capsicum annuum]
MILFIILSLLLYGSSQKFSPKFLTDILSPSISNLTRMKWLSFGTNNFSRPLSPELGDLTKLTQIYVTSVGVSAPIPLTFAKLRNMDMVWASDNDFIERILDFIHSWSSVTALFLVQGLGIELVPYAPLLVVPLLRCMSDSDYSVR